MLHKAFQSPMPLKPKKNARSRPSNFRFRCFLQGAKVGFQTSGVGVSCRGRFAIIVMSPLQLQETYSWGLGFRFRGVVVREFNLSYHDRGL